MSIFRYVAIDSAGGLRHGASEAESEAALVQALRSDGLSPLRVEPDRGTSWIGSIDLSVTRRGFRRQDVANLTRELAIMLAAGQDLDGALRFLTEMAPNPRLKKSLGELRNAVRDGTPLAAAMAKQPGSFSRLYIGLVRAGEAGGNLAATLERLAVVLERERALASSIRSAMIYPTLLLIAMIGSVSFLLTSVLPEFVPLFAQNGAKLPRSTQFMIDSGHILSAYGIYILTVIALVGLSVRQLLKLPAARVFADRQMLRLPIFGTLAREILAARFCRTFGTLMLNGVALIAALAIVREVIGNTAAVAAVDVVSASVKSGAGLATPLSASGLFPARMVYLLRLGEETAQLGQLCLRAAEIHEEETRLSLQRLVAMLVPGITIVLGAAVAGIVSSLILAMLSLNNLAG